MTGESNSLLETIRLIETIESAIPCGEQGDRIDVNRRLIATEVAVALLPYLDAQFAAGAEAMREALRIAAIEKAAWFDAQKNAHCADRADGIRAFLLEIKYAAVPARCDKV